MERDSVTLLPGRRNHLVRVMTWPHSLPNGASRQGYVIYHASAAAICTDDAEGVRRRKMEGNSDLLLRHG